MLGLRVELGCSPCGNRSLAAGPGCAGKKRLKMLGPKVRPRGFGVRSLAKLPDIGLRDSAKNGCKIITTTGSHLGPIRSLGYQTMLEGGDDGLDINDIGWGHEPRRYGAAVAQGTREMLRLSKKARFQPVPKPTTPVWQEASFILAKAR